MIKIYNSDFRDYKIAKGLTITDPPYNQGYHYNNYKDKMSEQEYINLLSKIPKPCVIIHYPEETINLLPKAMGVNCQQVVCWVYNSNTGKQSRLISWWGCKPDLSKVKQPYKNLDDKRIQKRIAEGKIGSKLYDWWEINQVKNVSDQKWNHPCQIPEKVIQNIILTTANKGDKIIDVFAGSGTTCQVAQELGRKWIAIELNPEYAKLIEEQTAQQNLF